MGCTVFVDPMGDIAPTGEHVIPLSRADRRTAKALCDSLSPALAEGRDAILLCASPAFSPLPSTARLAKALLQTEFPDRKVGIVACGGFSFAAGMTLSPLPDFSADTDTVIAALRQNAASVRTLLWSTDPSPLYDCRIAVRNGRSFGAIGRYRALLQKEDGHFAIFERSARSGKVLRALIAVIAAYEGVSHITAAGPDRVRVKRLSRKLKRRFRGIPVERVYDASALSRLAGEGTVGIFVRTDG